MFVCDYRDGQWQTPKIVPYAPMELSPAASVLHYGQAVFEGMKAFKDDQGSVWLFRPDQNAKRINKSAERLAIPQFPEALFLDGMKQLITLEPLLEKQKQMVSHITNFLFLLLPTPCQE